MNTTTRKAFGITSAIILLGLCWGNALAISPVRDVSARGLEQDVTVTPLPTATPNLREAQIGKKATVMRYGPATTYPIAMTLLADELITLTGVDESQQWVLVKTRANQTGWVQVKDLAANPLKKGLVLAPVTDLPAAPPSIKGWKGEPVVSLCLNIETGFTGQYYIDNPTAIPSVDVFSEAGQILSHFVQFPVRVEQCDSALTIQMKVEQKYTKFVNKETMLTQYCFDGVKVEGTFTLESGKNRLVVKSDKTRAPQKSLSECPNSSPYEEEMRWVMANGLHKLWGDAVVPYLLESKQKGIAEVGVAQVASAGKKGSPYIPDLLALLDTRPDLEVEITKALTRVSGANLDQNGEVWKDWWPGYQPTIQPTIDAQKDARYELPPQNLAAPKTIHKWSSAPLPGAVIVGQVDAEVDQSVVQPVSVVAYQLESLRPNLSTPLSGVQIVGEIINNSTTPIKAVKVSYELLNNGKAVIQTGTIRTAVFVVAPGEKAAFGDFLSGVYGAGGIRITGITFMPAEETKASFAIGNYVDSRQGGFYTISGAIQNTDTKPVSYYAIVASFYNQAGLLVNYQSIQSDALLSGDGQIAPGGIDTFTFTVAEVEPFGQITFKAVPVP